MPYLKEQVLARVNTRVISNFLGLAGIATVLPFLIHLQWATGPLVNAILIITLFLVGIRSALVLCLLPSLMALAGGLLPAVLAPVVPFIMISNVIFVLSVDFIYGSMKDSFKSFWSGVIVGAFLKFLFLYFSINFITKLLIKQELAVKVAQMMGWAQFFTALTGGCLAFILLKWLKRL
ncbi:iron hydrogenase [Candidatus Falkowbacteria bacterium]|nr:MAG: iron hydrogenase [Candidatus Falkowbacteria bacterium]